MCYHSDADRALESPFTTTWPRSIVNPTHTTADVIVQSLIKHGVDTVFGLPGVQTYPMFDALARSDIQVIGARHEQGAAYMRSEEHTSELQSP